MENPTIIRLKPYASSAVIIKKVLMIIAIVMILGMLMTVVAEQMKINDQKHAGIFAGLMFLFMILANLFVFKPFQPKGMDLMIKSEEMILIDRRTKNIISTIVN